MSRLVLLIALAVALTAIPAAPALAGPAGVLTFSNATATPVTLSATPLKCMITDGESGASLNEIDGLQLEPFSARAGLYVEGRNSGGSVGTDDLTALLQGWLIGPRRDGLPRTRMRRAAKALAGALGSGGLCRFTDSLFGLLAYRGRDYAAAIVRVRSCLFCSSTTWTIQDTDRSGLKLLIGDGTNPAVTVDETRA